jgi:hypothetical protein
MTLNKIHLIHTKPLQKDLNLLQKTLTMQPFLNHSNLLKKLTKITQHKCLRHYQPKLHEPELILTETFLQLMEQF